MSEPVIKTILPAIFLSSLLISTAFALPFSPTSHEQMATNFTDVGYYDKNYHKQQKKYYKAEKNYNNKYYHGGRYYGHRYYARPPGWQALGCFAAGPVWYCP